MASAPSAGLFKPLEQSDPTVVGGYRLAAVLGTGGMGKVYLSYTPGGRPIAIKVIRAEFSEDPEFRRRFQREVQAAQRVQGLYTAPVIDSDTEGPQPWLATAYVPGPSLAHAVAQHGALPLGSVLLLSVGVAEALHVIHGAGIVHRDLKPANVLLASDGPRVIDFGIARAAESTALTGTGVSVGTPSFMAPEQAAAGTITPATDIFALGQIAAFAAIGSPAYGEGSSHAVLYRIVHEDPDLSRVPAELLPLVTRCLTRDPDGRPSLTEVIELCHEISPEPLRQGEDWLPRSVAGSITERLQLPEPAKTPPPQPTVAPTPTPTAFSPQPPPQQPPAQHPPPPQPPAQHPPTQYAPHQPAPGPAHPQPPTGFPPAAAAPTQSTPGVPGAVPPPPGHPGRPIPPPGYGTPPPAAHRPYAAPPPPKPKRTGLIVAASVVGVLVVLGIIGALLPDDSGKDDESKSPGTSTGSTTGGGTGGDGDGSGDGEAAEADKQRPDPKPVSYEGIDITQNYGVMLAEDPPRPQEGDVLYGGHDLYYYVDTLWEDTWIGTDNGKFVLLNNAQEGSLETCRTETRYTEKITLDQISEGSQFCVLSDAGHIAVATYGGKAESGDATYATFDLTIWRNAEEPVTED